MTLGSASVIRGNARHLPLADNSVDLVVTSPPYFALRSYQDGGEHYAGQIGDEPTPAEFVASLLEVTRECVRVLKPSGSLWVNLGDKYAQPGKGERNRNGLGSADLPEIGAGFLRSAVGQSYGGVRGKSLIGIPWRYALACIDDLGLILRAEVIWSKPNGLPESVTDRVRRSHEQWFHFTREPRYFSAVDEIREAHKPGQSPSALSFNRSGRETAPGQTMAPHRVGRDDQGLNPLGKLPGSVWTVPTEPLRVPDHLGIDHFAAFPTEWPKRIIQGWSPQGVCVECGEGRRPRPDCHDHRLLLRLPRTHRRHPPERRPRPIRGNGNGRDGRQSPRPPRHHRRHVRRLLPPRGMAHQ
jgi:DNA modification methylase